MGVAADRDALLDEMGRHFKDIAQWAVDSQDVGEITIVNEELAKLAHQLHTMQIVKESKNGH